MSLWERIVHLIASLFPHHPGGDASARVDAAFRDTMAAQIRASTAAERVVDTATVHRARVDAVRQRIGERIAEHEARKHRGQTSHVVSVVEDALRARSFGGSEDL